mgnify:CR=1 FL=1
MSKLPRLNLIELRANAIYFAMNLRGFWVVNFEAVFAVDSAREFKVLNCKCKRFFTTTKRISSHRCHT